MVQRSSRRPTAAIRTSPWQACFAPGVHLALRRGCNFFGVRRQAPRSDRPVLLGTGRSANRRDWQHPVLQRQSLGEHALRCRVPSDGAVRPRSSRSQPPRVHHDSLTTYVRSFRGRRAAMGRLRHVEPVTSGHSGGMRCRPASSVVERRLLRFGRVARTTATVCSQGIAATAQPQLRGRSVGPQAFGYARPSAARQRSA